MRPRRVLGYARVSSQEQALGTSLQDQQDVIRAHAEKRGLTVDRMHVEAESAIHEKIERREEMRALMGDVRPGDLVLVDKVDRWSRDPEFTYRSIREILGRGASFFAVGDDCDPSTPQGDSMLGMRVFFAREEHKRIRLRTLGTRRLLRDRGLYVEGVIPWGYQRGPQRGIERHRLLVVEAEAARVRTVFRLSIEGRSLSEIAEALGIARDRVHTALRNRVYLGELRNGAGHWIRGQHDPIVDARTWEEAHAAIDRRRLGQRRSREESRTASWWLRELARCALCGAKMSAAYGPMRKSGIQHGYYCCYGRCVRELLRVDHTETSAVPIVAAKLEELAELLASSKPPAPHQGPPAIDVELRKGKVAKKRARFLELFAEDLISREELGAQLDKLDRDRTRLDALLVAPEPPSKKQTHAALRSVRTMRKLWNGATPKARRQIVGTLASAARMAPRKETSFDWYSVEDLTRRG